jgi:predicted nucleotidyltransferase
MGLKKDTIQNQVDIRNIRDTILNAMIKKCIPVSKIYLFGSRARGNFTENSDYDILLVLGINLEIKKRIQLFTQLRKLLAINRYNVDIVIKSSEEVDYYKNKIGHIVRSAMREGIPI